jgi:hypothetical protein
MLNIFKYLPILTLSILFSVQASAIISDRDHISLYAANIEVKFDTIKWETINYKPSAVTDQVTTQTSSTKKSKKVAKKKINPDEEMVFYSYKKPEKKKLDNAPKISIEDLSKLGFSKTPKPKKEIIDYSKFIQSSYSKKAKGGFKVQITGITKNRKKSVSITDFDLVPYYDLNEVKSDNGTGSISIPVTSQGSDYSTFRASVAARGLVRTNFEISAQDELLINIPVFEIGALADILDKHEIAEEYGSHFLVDLGSGLDSTTIEGKFKKKIFLNDRYRVVEEGSSYRFELYLDVEPGNHMVKYMDMKGRVAEKIIHISQGEVTYDEPHIEKSRYVDIDLFEENLISKKLDKVDIDRNFVTFFNRSKASKKIGLNRYKVNVPIKDASFRRYISIGEENPVYLGFRNIKKATIPSEEYVNYIKSLFQLAESSKACVVQMNLTSHLKDFRANVTSDKETGSYEIYFMDKDGTFSREMTGLSERAFVVSHDFGVINARIDYANGKTEYIQSFCTENLYLIEQL